MYCHYCSKKETTLILPNLLHTNQEIIMNSIAVCINHKELGIKQLIKEKIYQKEKVND
jgi:hypothetical protein